MKAAGDRPVALLWTLLPPRLISIVSAALRAALTAELNGPAGPLGRLVFRNKKKIKDAKSRRALIRASLTSRSSGSPLHSVAPSARLHYADSAQLRRWLDKKDLFTMKPAVLVVILLCLVSFAFAEEKYPKPPQELVEIGKTHGCTPVEFDLTNWPGGVDPPFLYGILPGAKSDSVAFWCKKVPESYPPYVLIVIVKLPDHEWSKCPQEIHSINPAKGLSLSPPSSLDGFVYLDNPKVSPPDGEHMKYNAIKSGYDGAGEIFYCYKGRWVVNTFH